MKERPVLACALALLIVNLAIAGKLFGVEYSAYNGSIEPTFIAIARVMAKYPGHWSWWPFWNGGQPFETAYLPFLQWMVAGLSLLTGVGAARAFHIVTAAFYVLGAPAFFWMARELSRKTAASFAAALAYSCLSASALLVPVIRADAGGPLELRRLQILIAYGEAPHTVALVLLPVAVVCFARALTTRQVKWKILAGAMSAAVVLSNAFGTVALGAALLCWLLAFQPRPWWRAVGTVAAIGVVSYCWTAPWLSFAMIRTIRANSSTTGGDYRYTPAAWIALAAFLLGYAVLWLALRRLKAPAHLQFFALFAYIPTVFVAAWYAWGIALIPQPSRYQLQMDMALPAALVFAGAALLERFPERVRAVAAAAGLAVLGVQTAGAVRYGWQRIRSAEPARMSEYRIAQWLDRHRPGERAFLTGSTAFWYNDFSDNPQVQGGHVQFAVNRFIPIVDFTVRTGMNAGNRDAEIAVFWLKAFGACTIAVTGPGSTDFFEAYPHPHKFDGILPLLWREGGDAIYEMPGRRASLAHVIPAEAVVKRTPAHGLDIEPARAYVAALDDPQYPGAAFQWKGMSEAVIRADVHPGQVVAVQVTYDRGWEAWSNGRRLPVRGDAIGQMVIEPEKSGPCEIDLRYTGGGARVIQRGMSLAAMLLAAAYAWSGRKKK